jgi:glycosyltransferase involved in cell wall biosynthesis
MTTAWSGQALVIVPTYNECENLERLVTQLRSLSNDIHVLIVDDNSPDGTGEIADRLASLDGGVSVLHRAGKLGLGTAYIAGFHRGLERGYQYLCTMDADFSHDPASLPSLIDKAASGYDLVVGSRYIQGGGMAGRGLGLRMLSYGANSLARLFLRITIHDCTAGFRCYRRTVLETLELDSIFSSGYSFLIEMAYRCQHAGFLCAEVPIFYVNRTEGTSKISKREIYKALYTLFRLRTSSLPWNKFDTVYNRWETSRSDKVTR